MKIDSNPKSNSIKKTSKTLWKHSMELDGDLVAARSAKVRELRPSIRVRNLSKTETASALLIFWLLIVGLLEM